ncbi:T9SS type A sorting domain-containing protein [Fibrobacter sp.]|uniref:T9SS type A sorting domain-containing protein n=1 Tax=Fibrobacter sp. TaxID=35828 RepID=UPI00386EDA52
MNKKVFAALALLSVSAAVAGEFDTWWGDAPQIETGLGNETNTYGYWFSYDDHDDGGNSKIVWPVELGNEYSATAIDPVLEHCSGICGTAVLEKGSLTYQPFVGIGFNVVGQTSATDSTIAAGDASAWGGICIGYASPHTAMSLELGLGDYDATIGYANPSFSLTQTYGSYGAKYRIIPWSKFTQPSWYKGDVKITGEEAAKRLVSIKFKIQADPGEYFFIVGYFSPYNECVQRVLDGNSIGIKPNRGPSKAKATLLGRNLGIFGVNSAATVEVRNIQGQVVAKGSIGNGSMLDLSSLDAGVYMVQVAGKSVNFVDKIVLK